MRQILARSLFVDQWCIGVVDAPVSTFLRGRPNLPVRWLVPPSPNCYYADPFAAERDEELTILLEEFDYNKSRGRISSVMVNAEGFSGVDPIISPPAHLSYPYTFTHNGEIYCVPEAKETCEVTLYRSTRFPDRWEKVGPLIEDFAGVDSTIFRYGDRWWLTAADHFDAPYEKLKVWHAMSLTGPWLRHRLPVVKRDVSSSRPGGKPFWHEGVLYRPAQDCSETYGGRIVINRIDRLTPSEFLEVPVSTVEPYPGPFRYGLHTLSAANDHMTLIDGKKRVFIGAHPALWKHKMRRLLDMATGSHTSS